MSDRIIEAAIARRVRYGCREDESRALLQELVRDFAAGDNLAFALHYNGFATARGAELLAAALEVAA